MAAGPSPPPLLVFGRGLQISDRMSTVLDNARFIMLVLVVLTHSIIPEMPGYSAVLAIINPFQTRALAFISGVVSDGKDRSFEAVRQSSRDTLVQIIVFCVFLDPICHRFFAGTLTFDPVAYARSVVRLLLFSGQQIHWYLFGLLWWRLLSWLLAHVAPDGHGKRVLISLNVAAFATYKDVPFLSVSEALACWPLYVAGDLCRRLWKKHEDKYHIAWSPLPFFTGMLAFLGLHLLVVKLGWTQHFPFSGGCIPWAMQELDYDNDSMSGRIALLLRGCVGYGLMLGKIVVFLVVCCPDMTLFFTRPGRNTIFPYLLHYPVVPVYRHFLQQALGFGTYSSQAHLWILALFLSILIVTFLSSESVIALFWRILMPFRRPQSGLVPAEWMPVWVSSRIPCTQS